MTVSSGKKFNFYPGQTYIRSISETTHHRTLILGSIAGFSRSGYLINSAQKLKKSD